MKPEHRECEVCHRERDVWVCSSAFVPMSHAICRECLAKPAEPLIIFRHLLEDVAGGDPSRLDKSIHNWYTWMDGKYVHWSNYIHIHREIENGSQDQAQES